MRKKSIKTYKRTVLLIQEYRVVSDNSIFCWMNLENGHLEFRNVRLAYKNDVLLRKSAMAILHNPHRFHEQYV